MLLCSFGMAACMSVGVLVSGEQDAACCSGAFDVGESYLYDLDPHSSDATPVMDHVL